MMKRFRRLRADEIECRVSQINEKGLTLLLYKDARCDMNMLDEAVGPENWQCQYSDHKGTLFCSVGILTDSGWIWKEDAGAPSNMESQKGEASDAFKRACFRWGIGRELYTAPFIWVPAGNYQGYQKNGKWATYDRFTVTAIGYDEAGNINQLTVVNQKVRKTVFELKCHNEEHISAKEWNVLKGLCADHGIKPEDILEKRGCSKPSEITQTMYLDMIREIEGGKG